MPRALRTLWGYWPGALPGCKALCVQPFVVSHRRADQCVREAEKGWPPLPVKQVPALIILRLKSRSSPHPHRTAPLWLSDKNLKNVILLCGPEQRSGGWGWTPARQAFTRLPLFSWTWDIPNWSWSGQETLTPQGLQSWLLGGICRDSWERRGRNTPPRPPTLLS